MKIVKAELQDGLHSEFKVWAYQQGVTMAQALVGLIETGIAGSRYKTSSKPVSEPKKGGVVVEPINATAKQDYVSVREPLKEDHGWCKGCGTRQVRLPAMLCAECRKEAGEDL